MVRAIDEKRDHDYDRANGDEGEMNENLVLWVGGCGVRRNRGENRELDGETLISVRASFLAHVEPVLLGH